jgi:2'-5' RNA ligase
MPVYKDYMIVLSLSKNVKKNIARCKNYASDLIGNYPGLNSIAHISLWNKQDVQPEMIRALVTILQRKINEIPPVTLTINGFEFFVNGKDTMTIYAAIHSNFIIEDWFNIVLKQLNLKPKGFVPHITVTKTIHVDSFYKLWPKFNRLPLKLNFVPESISILERDPLPFAKWHTYDDIYFKNVPQL